ncbi:MAG: hypothetical protein ABSG65_18155, partial [Bryobacteraceae bacterium]
MTIAAGFVCSDGVVLCSDTLHEGWKYKLHSTKLLHFDCWGAQVGFAFAGATDLAISAIEKCERRLKKNKPEDFIAALECILDRQYRKSVS